MHDSGRGPTPAARAVAWGGALIFVASLSYFLFSFHTRFGIVTVGPVHAADVGLDVALFSIFAMHHSVLARESIRSRIIHALPHLERSVYVWLASVLLILVCWLWRPVAGVVWDLASSPVWIAWALLVLQVAGLWLSIYSAALIDIWELAGVKQPTTGSSGSWEFSTRGPYGWVRHPIYLGWFLIVFCVTTMTMTRFVFAVVSCAYVLIAIPFEERSLRKTTNGAYDRYEAKVPWKLVPRVY